MLMFMHVTNMNGMYLKWYVVWYILFMRPPKHKQKAFGSILLRLVSFGMLNTFEYSRYSIQNNAQQKNRWSLWIFAMFFLQERRTIGGFIAPMPCQQTTCKCKILFSFSKKIFKTTEIPEPAVLLSIKMECVMWLVHSYLN